MQINTHCLLQWIPLHRNICTTPLERTEWLSLLPTQSVHYWVPYDPNNKQHSPFGLRAVRQELLCR
jgi:hypothetical protein